MKSGTNGTAATAAGRRSALQPPRAPSSLIDSVPILPLHVPAATAHLRSPVLCVFACAVGSVGEGGGEAQVAGGEIKKGLVEYSEGGLQLHRRHRELAPQLSKLLAACVHSPGRRLVLIL